jgi:multiple sugar transport system ATP-binding protein
MAKVRLEHVWKRFGKVVAVKDFNLETEDGEFVVFVGPSGCGKTTTLRMIAGLEEISEGRIYIGDRLVNDVPPKDRDIAMVFQNYALYPHMNVYENMAFGLRLRRYPKDEIDRRVKEAARILKIEHLLNRKPRELSGGQRQRVAMGRAIVREPKVFLMDEPLSNLDAKLRVEMRAEIAKLQRRLGVTTIYVTHDQVEAMTLGHRIVVMKDGEIQQVDTPLNLYDFPANRFVAGFIGSPSMNFIRAHVEAQGDRVYLTAPGFRVRPTPCWPRRCGPMRARRSGWASAPSTWASRGTR